MKIIQKAHLIPTWFALLICPLIYSSDSAIAQEASTSEPKRENQKAQTSELTLKLNSRCQKIETILEGTKYEYLSHYLPGISQAITELNNISSIPFEKYKDPSFYIATLMEIMGSDPLKKNKINRG